MDATTKTVAKEERRARSEAVDNFRAACLEFANKYNAGELEVPTFTRRVWKYMPMCPPIPFFFRTRVVFDFWVFKGWYTYLANNGKMVTGPGFLQAMWSTVGLGWNDNDSINQGTERLRAIMADPHFFDPEPEPEPEAPPKRKLFARC